MDVTGREALEELFSRARPLPTAGGAPRRLADFIRTLFRMQRDVLASKARRIAVLCTRRAGKTTMVPAALFKAAERNPGCVVLFLASTAKRAGELAWEPLRAANNAYRLGYIENNTKMTLRNPRNGAEIRLYGVDNVRELEKRRGDKIAFALVDETQNISEDILRKLVDDVLWPGMVDVDGCLVLMGTPGYVCRGYWYDITRNDAPTPEVPDSRKKRIPGWKVFEWSALDNTAVTGPNGETMSEMFAAELARLEADPSKGPNHPTVVREYRGRWVVDVGALFYSFESTRNTYAGKLPEGHEWRTGMGVDLGKGFALVVHVFAPTHPVVYERASYKSHGTNANDWRAKTREFIDAHNPDYCVVDHGGLGVGIIEGWQEDGLPVQMAEKSDRDSFVSLINAEMEAGRVKVLPGSPLALEYGNLPKDPDSSPGRPPQPAPGFDDHACDAGLYSWRQAYTRCGRTDNPKRELSASERMQEMERVAKQRCIEEIQQQRAEEAGGW